MARDLITKSIIVHKYTNITEANLEPRTANLPMRSAYRGVELAVVLNHGKWLPPSYNYAPQPAVSSGTCPLATFQPKIKITPKKGEKGYRGPGAKPKPKQKTAKGSQPTTKGRQAAKTKQSTISTYIAPSIAAGGARKRGVTAPAQTDPPAKRQRTRGVRQPEPEDDNDSQDAIGKEDSSFAKGRVVSGKGKAKELVGGREARSRAARAGGARRKGVERGGVSKGLSGGTLIEEELERDGNMPRRSQRTRTATEQATYDSDGDYGRGEASVGGKAQKGGRKRGQQARHTRGSHASSDSDDGGSKLSGRAGRGGQEGGQGGRRLSSDSDGEVGGRATGKGERRKRGRMNKGAGRVSSDSDEGGSSKSLGKTREAGGGVPGRGSQTKETSEAMEEEKERATDGGRKRASVREVTIAGSSAAKWEAISEEADRVIGDAMVSAMG